MNKNLTNPVSTGELDNLSRSSMRMIQSRTRTSALYAQNDSDIERSMNATKAMIQEGLSMLPEDTQRLVRASVITYLKEAEKIRTEIFRLRERQEHNILSLQDAKMRLRSARRLSDRGDIKKGFFSFLGKKQRESEILRRTKASASKAIANIEDAINERDKNEETIQRFQIEERRILAEVNQMVQQNLAIHRGSLEAPKEKASQFSQKIDSEQETVFKEN